jgi:ferrous iron transport protein A
VVVEILGGYGMVRRLETLGIRVGVRITKLSAQFMHGPIVIQVNNTQAAIGFGMARRIVVEKQEARGQRQENWGIGNDKEL